MELIYSICSLYPVSSLSINALLSSLVLAKMDSCFLISASISAFISADLRSHSAITFVFSALASSTSFFAYSSFSFTLSSASFIILSVFSLASLIIFSDFSLAAASTELLCFCAPKMASFIESSSFLYSRILSASTSIFFSCSSFCFLRLANSAAISSRKSSTSSIL